MVRLPFVALIFVGLTAFTAPAIAEPLAPETVVETFHEVLIEAMKSDTYEDRVALLGPTIDQNFVIATTARISLGRSIWSQLSEEETVSYQSALRDLIVTTYAARFDNFNNQSFEIVGAKDIGKNRYRVDTKLHTKTEVVDLVYQLQDVDGQWQVYDVVAQGVSDLSQKRSNYTVMYNSGGLSAVLENVREETANNRASSDDNA